MILTISRTSDSFMTVELPSEYYPPHNMAKWDQDIGDWVIQVQNLDDLKTLCKDNEIRLVISKTGTPYLHLEIDDVTSHYLSPDHACC